MKTIIISANRTTAAIDNPTAMPTALAGGAPGALVGGNVGLSLLDAVVTSLWPSDAVLTANTMYYNVLSNPRCLIGCTVDNLHN